MTIVLRYDGSDWVQLGSELPGSDVPPGFVLSADGTPHVVVGGVLHVLRGDWQEMPLPPDPTFIPTLPPVGLARDAQGRFYTFAGSPDPDGQGYLLGVLRLTGSSWQLLGPPDSFNHAPTSRDLQLAADREGPYVAETDLDDAVSANVHRWNGRDWAEVGGGNFVATQGVFMVAPDGLAYFAPPGGSPITRGSATAPWSELPARGTVGDLAVPPGLALGTDGVLHVADMTDRDPGPAIVPGPIVSRLEGDRFTELTPPELEPTVLDTVKLRIARSGGAEVLYLAYSRDLRVVVQKLQR